MTGRIHQINAKPKTTNERGLPKRPVEKAAALRGGLEGDFNRYRHEQEHDDSNEALLVMPLETIHQLNAEGWPVRPGDLGENLTTTGIPYNRFGSGKIFTAGQAEIQISKPCDPCTNLYLLPYVGEEKGAAFLKVMMGRRGWYARVLHEGLIRKGDPVMEHGSH